ncbi:MAG: ATP-binding protein [Actinomycetota bacterium]
MKTQPVQARSVAKCKRCGDRARVEVPRANTAFCNECFVRYVRNQVSKAIDEFGMFSRKDRLLVCVSGGKDSLALWDILLADQYDTTGFYIALGTEDSYSDESKQRCIEFAKQRGVDLIISDIETELGFSIGGISGLTGRVPCSACGLVKRSLTNATANRSGFDVLVTGHNLDDEAATLMGNTLHWQTDYMRRQFPVLPATSDGFAKKAKPLYRVTEKETAAYAFIRDIEYVVDECPLVGGNTQLKYKNMLNELEKLAPGTKQQFLFGFLDRMSPQLREQDAPAMRSCKLCGEPTIGEECALCKLRAEISRKRGQETVRA